MVDVREAELRTLSECLTPMTETADFHDGKLKLFSRRI